MPVLKPPSSSSLTTVGAGKYGVRIRKSASDPWVWLMGLSKFGPTPKPKMEDDSDINGDAYSSEVAMGNGVEIAIEGFVKGEDVGTFTTDPGLAILLAAMYEIGVDNMVYIQWWRHDDLPEAKECRFAVDAKMNDGKPDESQKFSGTLKGRGKPMDIAKPQVQPKSYTVKVEGTGNYTLAVDGVSTGSLADSANAAAMQTALAALPNVGAGNVTVSGTTTITVTLANGGTLTGNGSGLTGTPSGLTVTPV